MKASALKQSLYDAIKKWRGPARVRHRRTLTADSVDPWDRGPAAHGVGTKKERRVESGKEADDRLCGHSAVSCLAAMGGSKNWSSVTFLTGSFKTLAADSSMVTGAETTELR